MSMLNTAVPTLSRRRHGGYWIGQRHCPDSRSLSGIKNDDDARRFGFVRPQERPREERVPCVGRVAESESFAGGGQKH